MDSFLRDVPKHATNQREGHRNIVLFCMKSLHWRATALAILLTSAVCLPVSAQAQDATRRELATRIVNLQKTQDMDTLIVQLADTANRAVVDAWLPRLNRLPAARQKSAASQLDIELKKFNDENIRLIRSRNDRISLDVLVPAYAEKFTTEELRQLITFLESPVIKKYYAANPQLANLLAQKLVDATRADVENRIKAFDAKAERIIGTRN